MYLVQLTGKPISELDGALHQPFSSLSPDDGREAIPQVVICAEVLARASGAPLSHAAIVARELGIPAVVGCGNATMRLKTGDRVRVDGTAGTVEVLQ